MILTGEFAQRGLDNLFANSDFALHRRILGSVSTTILHECKCNVLVIRDPADQGKEAASLK